jgi:hypothetical protein
MTQIPPDTVTQKDLEAWYQATQELTRAKANEILLRMRIFKHYFPAPVEGTNTFVLPDGYELKGVHKINRTVEPAALVVLAPKFEEAKIVVGDLIEYKPDLKTKEYRTLTDEQRNLFDQALIIKDGTPDVKIVLPARNKAK